MTNLILLAAGRGSRLRFMTNDIPKCLNLYQEKTLLQHILDRVTDSNFEFEEIIIVGGYKWQSLLPYGNTLIINQNWASTGPFGSLEIVDEYLSKSDSVISYTDIYFSTNFLKSCVDSREDIFVPSNENFLKSWGSRQVDVLADLESFRSEKGIVLEIGKKVRDIGSVQGQFAGLVRMSPLGWASLKSNLEIENRSRLDITTAIQNAIENGVRINTDQVNGVWKEFDEVSDFYGNESIANP